MNNLFIKDLFESSRLKFFWLKLSWLEFYGWYGRLNLGLAWVIISPAIFSLGISVVYAEAFGSSLWEHFLYVYGGYVCWLFIAETLSNGAEIYNSAYSYYSETKLPLVGFNLKGTLVRSYTLGLNTIAFVIVALFSGEGINFLLIPILLVLLLSLSLTTSIVLSISFAYFPDLKLIIQNTMRLLFFLTPIVWVPNEELKGIKAILVYANPFYYVVESYRQLISSDIDFYHFYILSVILSAMIVLSMVLYNMFSRKMVFVCK